MVMQHERMHKLKGLLRPLQLPQQLHRILLSGTDTALSNARNFLSQRLSTQLCSTLQDTCNLFLIF